MQQRFLLQILLLAQHVSGITMPIIRSSRVLLPAWEHKFHKNLQNYFLHFYSTKYHRQQPLYNTLEPLVMGIVMPETCWASNKICNKNLCCICWKYSIEETVLDYWTKITTVSRKQIPSLQDDPETLLGLWNTTMRYGVKLQNWYSWTILS